MTTISNDILDKLKTAAGPKGWSMDAQELEPHLVEWRGRWQGRTPILLKPSSSAEISDILKICNQYGCKIVPQGGNTGLVNGGLPDESGDEVLLSLKRFNKDISVDPVNNTITADAGVTVKHLQDAARDHDRLFPLSLASEGSCTVGGIISTNAGGVHVLRYGTTRDLALGLEAVLPTGEIISDLSGLRKDNTGYNLSQLLIGAEGTLGIVTRATFKLYPAIKQRFVMMVGVDDAKQATTLLQEAKAFAGDQLSAFELMPQSGIEIVLKHINGTSAPFPSAANWFVLIEFGLTATEDHFAERLENWLALQFETARIMDGTLSQNERQAEALWHLRETMSEAQKLESASIKHDISVPISKIDTFLTRADAAAKTICPTVRPMPFGHLGDGNLHYNLSQPLDMDANQFMALEDAFNAVVHDVVMEIGGSISAEHGIGKLKIDELEKRKKPADLAAMRAIKKALDPNGIINMDRILKG